MKTRIFNKELLVTAKEFHFLSIGNYIVYYAIKDGYHVIVMATEKIK